MMILATVAINGVLGEDGLINQTRKQKEESELEVEQRQEEANEVREQYNQTMKDKDKALQRQWVQTISGNGEDKITDVIETSDGGYIAIGYSTSTNIDWLFTNKGESDAFIIKYNANGKTEWYSTIGGNHADWFSGIIENNGEYIVVGSTLSDTITTKKGETLNKESGSVAGIIAKYDNSGNEVFIKFDQNNATSWGITEEQYEYMLFTDIAKTDNGYAITGKLDYNDNPINTSYLILLEYNNKDALIKKEKLWENHNSGTVQQYTDFNVNLGTAHIESNALRYILYGSYSTTNILESRVQRIYQTDKKEEKNVIHSEGMGEAGRVYNIATNVIYDVYGTMIINTHNYIPTTEKLTAGSICIIDETSGEDKVTWIENADYKSMTKVSSTMFATLKTPDDEANVTKMQRYTNTGTPRGEYDIPNYTNLYKVGVDESYIFTGSPTNEQGIENTGTEDAVISKYKLVDKDTN